MLLKEVWQCWDLNTFENSYVQHKPLTTEPPQLVQPACFDSMQALRAVNSMLGVFESVQARLSVLVVARWLKC